MVWLLFAALLLSSACAQSADPVTTLDPRAWGSDHVGRPLPEFTSGDQCLFCHRDSIGTSWWENRHGRTVRVADPDSAALSALLDIPQLAAAAGEVEYVLGNARRQRFLKSGPEYGQLLLLSAEWVPPRDNVSGQIIHADKANWDAQLFGDSCAGCHATAVNSATRRFEAISLDCFVCHGDVPANHTGKPEVARFSSGWEGSAREEMSVCGQCHLRGGQSDSSGLPYPNNFVPGDNLFRDFRVDLSEAVITRSNPADGHIRETVRDVVLHGKEELTCMSCHDVHGQSTQKHKTLDEAHICLHCHQADGPKSEINTYEVHSTTCRY